MRRATPRNRNAFTLIELLVVIAIISLLAAILFPVFAEARHKARQAACASHLRQIGMAFAQYQQDWDQALPDRRDLKGALPGGYRPWSGWPETDARSAWAAVVTDLYIQEIGVWNCPAVSATPLGEAPQVVQIGEPGQARPPVTNYWMWRFDNVHNLVPLHTWWGKTDEQAVADLCDASAADASLPCPGGVAEAELAVDPFFPAGVDGAPPGLAGRSPHMGGRNRLFLDGHVGWASTTNVR
jgi:prepilin-type N-terminal cleavage/methylation domain-containing protein/prepilin-type processing-associated H-X9-DG protein